MTYILSLDPGKNTGAALGFYDAITPYRLVERWQIHGGVDGFIAWWREEHAFDGALAWRPGEPAYDLVCEKFNLDSTNRFLADLTPVEIEGALRVLNGDHAAVPIMWQPRTDKAALTGYPPEAVTKAQRQRVRFDFLDRFGLFKAGEEYTDSNDAVTHSLVNLKRRLHYPSITAFWPQPIKPTRLIRGESSPSASPGF